MKKILFPLLAILVLLSCSKEQITPAGSEADTDLDLRAKKETVTLCHLDDQGAYVSKEINVKAEKAHLGHGDFAPREDGSCCSNENLLTVTLPDGATLYVQPNDNRLFVSWGPLGVDIPGLVNYQTIAEAEADLSGFQNTQMIVAALGDGDYAAKVCADLVYGGCDNWSLPSAGELKAMYEQDVLTPGRYWSSTEFDVFDAWVQNATSGSQFPGNKVFGRRCRCVRR